MSSSDVNRVVKEVSLQEFLEVISYENSHGFAYKYLSFVSSIWSHYLDQNKYILVNCTHEEFASIEDQTIVQSAPALFNFGIGFVTLDSAPSDRRYLLVIPSSVNENNLAEFCEKFCTNYLPEGVTPQYFILERNISTVEERDYWFKKVAEVFPFCTSLNSYAYLLEEQTQGRRSDKIVQELEDAKIELMMIDDYVKPLLYGEDNIERSTNVAMVWPTVMSVTVKIVKEYRERSKSAAAKGKRLFVALRDSSNSSFVSLMAYLFYKYNVPSYFEDFGATSVYLKGISSLCFNPSKMLMEDQILFVKEFPDITIARTDNSDYVALTLNRDYENRGWLEGSIKVRAARFSKIDQDFDEYIDETFDINEIKVLKLQDYFKSLISSDMSEIRQESSVLRSKQGRLLKLLCDISDSLERDLEIIGSSEKSIVDLTKILMFEYYGDIYFSYVFDWSFNFNVLMKSFYKDELPFLIRADKSSIYTFCMVMSAAIDLTEVKDLTKEAFSSVLKRAKAGNLTNASDPQLKRIDKFLRGLDPMISAVEIYNRVGAFHSGSEGLAKRYIHDYAEGLLLDAFYRRDPRFFFHPEKFQSKLSPGLNFKTIGLWSQKTYNVRIGMIKELSENIKINKHRKIYNYFSVFGGPLPIFENFSVYAEDENKLTEDYIKE